MRKRQIFVFTALFLLNGYYLIAQTQNGSTMANFTEIKGELIKAVGGIVIVLLGWLFSLIRGLIVKKLAEIEINTKIGKSELGKKIIGKVKKTIPEIFSELYLESRLVIKKIVEDGEVDKIEIEEAVRQIRDRLYTRLKKSDIDILDEVFSDGKEWIESKIKDLLVGVIKKN